VKAPRSAPVSLRAFRINDYKEVFRLGEQAEGVGLNESDTRPAIASFLRRNPGLSFVAIKQDKIIGAVLCGHDGRRGYLHHLAVAKRYRGHGIGLRLVESCLAKLRAADVHKCNIFVFAGHAAGMSFWKHNDWKLRTDLRVMQMQLSKVGGLTTCSC
jgi:ribosomal protein S18 acetylase RimI-like enzyme